MSSITMRLVCRICKEKGTHTSLKGSEKFCPECGGETGAMTKEIGGRRSEKKIVLVCRGCGARIANGQTLCKYCGQSIGVILEEEGLGCLGCAGILAFIIVALLVGIDHDKTGQEPQQSEKPKTEAVKPKSSKPKAAKTEAVKKKGETREAKSADLKHARFLSKCYTSAQAMLRSDTTEQAVPLAALPYGSELETCIPTSSWYKLTVSLSNQSGAGGKEGYVEQAYIMNAKDFKLLNSIWGSFQSRNLVEQRRDFLPAEFRRALLNYYKKKGYAGRLSAEEKRKVGLQEGAEEWQVFMREGEVVFQKLLPSKYTGIGFLIENIKNGNRKFLYFYFDKGGKAKLLSEQDAPKTGSIVSIAYTTNANPVSVQYSSP